MFSISRDNERFHGTYATVKEALQGAMDDLGLGHREAVWVGEVIDPGLGPRPDADDLLELARDRAGDEYGECAEDWLDVGKLEEAELDAEFAKVWEAWLKKHDLTPRFWGIGKVEQLATPRASEEEVKTCHCDDCDAWRKAAA